MGSVGSRVQDEFDRRFPELRTENYRHVQFPYAFDAAQLEGELALMMADLQADETKKLRYESMSIDKFWLGMDERHELISHYVTKHLVKFGTTYACEAAFSTMLAIKSKYRTRITNEHLEHNLVIAITNYTHQDTFAY